jgi:dihydroneopterin aldolase
LAQHIIDKLFVAFPRMGWITIAVRKPGAPIAMVSGVSVVLRPRV